MSDKVNRKAVQRLIADCEEAHALYASHGVSGAEGARMMSEAARGLTDLLAEVERLREALHSVAFRSVDDDIHWCQRIAKEALAKTSTPPNKEKSDG